MKRNFLKLSTLLIVSLLFTVGCDKSNDPNNSGDSNNPATTDVGVVINGVKWATRNVDAFGTFAATPESAGMLYQWNRKKAWSATDETVADWDTTYPSGWAWEKVNDPSPKGWRVPTAEEQRSLLDTDKVTSEWTTQNGVTGRKFTDKTSGKSIFLPAAGYRGGSDGTLLNAGADGGYWDSVAYEFNETGAYYLDFNSDDTNVYYANRRDGQPVRCVAE